ncbi:MAG: Asp23/Gls24 family envelope stress response protein [Desulfitobacteriaceae bacterium]|nr:Asp23/Gls24 family envelope stress response protein [Desulfitobacteriaceae bacterium]MDD4752340.1 Asp23/Gls24 family envelope stress response protein [Desulfitobacteriaceae bacterium]
MEKTVIEKQDNNTGSVRIADDVVAIIAGLAATEVEGVAGMSGGIAGGIAEILGRKNLSKGVKVEVGETEAAIDIFVIVDFGARIPDVALKIQENVKKAVESMTGLKAIEINVHVQGVAFPNTEVREEETRVK